MEMISLNSCQVRWANVGGRLLRMSPQLRPDSFVLIYLFISAWGREGEEKQASIAE